MQLLEQIRNHKAEILSLASKHGVKDVRVIGSVARGEDDENSDIDFLVNMEKDRSLLDYVGFKLDMEDIFLRKVDLVCESAIRDKFKNKIETDIKYI